MSGVEIEGVSRCFGSVVAVDNIDFKVEPGEFVALLGPSGCGKTTTLRMVAGLERNSRGRISIGGRVVSDAAAGYFMAPDRRQLGMVFQSYAIWPHMTVFDNVAYPLRIRRRPKDEIRERVLRALKLVEMQPYAERAAPALSGGQQQRVAIARAVVFEPEVLLLDEPLSNLDTRLRAQMGDEFRALQRRLGITSLYVTHDQEEAMSLSDRVVVMQEGRILQVGAPEDIYQRPRSEAVAAFFGSPNLLEGEVARCRSDGNGGFFLRVTGASWEGECRAGEAFAEGEPVIILVRPENVHVAEAGGGGNSATNGAIAWTGQVVQLAFRGARVSLSVETPAQRLMVESPALLGVREGDRLTLSVAPHGAWAIRPGARPRESFPP
ncbi:MAG: ABC transporter ATP-binding protein [Hyphomicrobiaceae bacterium]|nr:ABC transporter ATP-binding protein [Hyphomicrobiaceae bacterium]